MAGAEVTANDLSRTGSRSLVAVTHAVRWRDKLREKAGKLKATVQPTVEEQESNVSDFLGNTPSSGHTRPITLGLQIPTHDSLDPASYAPIPTDHKRPPKKSKGLNVSFSDEEPEIIGQGGDECEIPSRDVVGSWPDKTSQAVSQSAHREQMEIPQALSPGTSQEFLTAERFTNQKAIVHRNPTRKPVGGWEQRRLSMNMEEGLVQAYKSGDTDNRIPNETQAPSHARSSPRPVSNDQTQLTSPQLTPPILVSSAQTTNSPPKAYHPTEQIGHGIRTNPSSRHERQLSQGNEADIRGLAYKQALPIRVPPASPKKLEGVPHNYGQETSHYGQAESDEFYSRVQHLRGVFRLAAEKVVDVESKALEHWLRMSSWWFLRGKTMLEKNTGAEHNENRTENSMMGHKTHQPYVDLAKAWWSMEDILLDLVGPHSKASVSNTFDKFDGLDYPHLLNTYHNLSKSMRDFAIFMQRNKLMPPPAVLIQGANPCVWISYPLIAPGILSLTASLDPRTLTPRVRRGYFPIIFEHTSRHSFLGRAFVKVDVLSLQGTELEHVPCLMSIFRERSRPDIELTIVSQDGQINLHIQHDPREGPTWTHVRWQNREASLLMDLSKDFRLLARLEQEDFVRLQEIYSQSQRIETEWHPAKCEQILFDSVVPVVHVTGATAYSNNFPPTPMKEISIRLFMRTHVTMKDATQRTIFDGYRLVARTSLTLNHPSCFSIVFAKSTPILCSNLRSENEAPALLLRLHKDLDKPPLVLTFQSVEQQSHFHILISGVLRFPEETMSKEIPLVGMSIVDLFGDADGIPRVHSFGTRATWNSLKVISEPQRDGLEHIMFSNSMRVCSTSNCGSVVDLANLGTGELQISLEMTDMKSIKVYRPAQDNTIVAFANNMVPKEELRNLQEVLDLTTKQPTARLYRFPTLQALHTFQRLALGFEVIYDGLATAFSISHRRNMIPVHKRQEASGARVQVLVQNNRGQKTFHLLAVLSDFPNGKIMSFQLHGADVFEATFKSSKYCLRFVDAKFALPKAPDSTEMAWDYTCLDMPEYPAEHDDIMIGFDSEEERDDLSRVLPGPIKTSLLQSLRR